MAVRPNFDAVQLDGSVMTVFGTSDATSPPPTLVHVFVEQAGHAVNGPFDKPDQGWQASITVGEDDFTIGQLALAYGVEMRMDPFQTTTWSQLIEINAPKA